jgi:hypothetical protein
VEFDAGIPSNWPVVDNAGDGVIWTNIAGSGESANYTGGTLDAASVSSDIFNDTFGPAEFDTELHSPQFSLAGYRSASLNFRANFQAITDVVLGNRDFLDLEVRAGVGAGWSMLLGWNEDHGTFRDLPGESVTVALEKYAPEIGLQVRWRYHDPHSGDYGWYAQIDEVELNCWTPVVWGDVDCNGTAGAVDALKVQRHVTGLLSVQTEPCPDFGTSVEPDFITTRPVGDVDCSGLVNAVDGLKIMRFRAGLPVQQTTPCPPLGMSVNLYY